MSNRITIICSIVVYLISMLFLLIGFCTPYWTWVKVGDYESYSGLWRNCKPIQLVDQTYDMECDNTDLNTQPAWFETVVAFLILALVVGVAAGILYMVKPASAALQLVSGLCVIIAIGIWAAMEDKEGVGTNYISWSFALTVTGGVLLLLNGGVLTYIANNDNCRCQAQLFDDK